MIATNIAYYFIHLVSVMSLATSENSSSPTQSLLNHGLLFLVFSYGKISSDPIDFITLDHKISLCNCVFSSSLKSKVQLCLSDYLWVPQKVQPHMHLKPSPSFSCCNSSTYYPLITACHFHCHFFYIIFLHHSYLACIGNRRYNHTYISP
ncbi:Uncharacterized protein Adt_29887 [Abeliophyllum distichum]|uniref:Uncharacterized protein n=1 Tax=Abeliophyllum distichum TaxID=126358 RepID=A0ABD1RAJ6_9LAMI